MVKVPRQIFTGETRRRGPDPRKNLESAEVAEDAEGPIPSRDQRGPSAITARRVVSSDSAAAATSATAGFDFDFFPLRLCVSAVNILCGHGAVAKRLKKLSSCHDGRAGSLATVSMRRRMMRSNLAAAAVS